jgi:hypothetical protein
VSPAYGSRLLCAFQYVPHVIDLLKNLKFHLIKDKEKNEFNINSGHIGWKEV